MFQNTQMKCAILRRKQVQARTGLSRSTIYEKVRAGSFPKPIHLSERAVGWVESEIEDWIIDQWKQSREIDSSPNQGGSHE